MTALPPFVSTLAGDITVSYSGGLDSTSVAYWAVSGGKVRAHLLTLDHGYGYLFNSWAARTARSLARRVGEDRIIHRYVKTRDLMDRLAVRSLVADRKKYGQWFGCCLGCTMAIITKLVIYNLENGIPHICFGSSVGGEYAVMSMPVSTRNFRQLCGLYGIDYRAPLLEDQVSKDMSRQALEQAGIFAGYRFLEKHSFGNQGYCLLSVQHLADVLVNVHPEYEAGAVQRFFDDKLPLCHAYIEEHYRRSGRSLQEDIARLEAIFRASGGGAA